MMFPLKQINALIVSFGILVQICHCNLPPVFTQDMNNHVLSESIPVGDIVYKLDGYDPEGGEVMFGIIGSDNFVVDSKSGDVKVIKPLDRETQDTLSFLVTIKDMVNSSGESENDNVVRVPVKVIVSDENDNPPEFQNTPYETEVLEDSAINTTVFHKILVIDKDTVGENLDLLCASENHDQCSKFAIEILKSDQDRLTAAVILKDKLDYNEKMIYQMTLSATDGLHTSDTNLEIRVKDVQNSPPVFQGSLTAVISEDSPIGTLVMTIQARDGDRGQPRKIIYELVTNPMDYFLIDSKSGEIRTAKPLDKEALPDNFGLITLTVRARELIDGTLGNEPLTMATTQASITISDVNDSPPTFNQKEYFVSLSENTAIGTPLPLEISVRDPDVGKNAIFSLRLEDVSNVFDIEPKIVTGSSQVSIRVASGPLDYENPNQRKFIVLIIAEESETDPKLSSTATLTVSVTDANDNRPTFDQDSYTATISETANPGQLITTINARDLDSGLFGDQGIRYSISGTGAELFHVDSVTGAITVAACPELNGTRKKRFTNDKNTAMNENTPENINVTLIDGNHTLHTIDSSTKEMEKGEYLIYNVHSNVFGNKNQNINNDNNLTKEFNKTTVSMNDLQANNTSANLANNVKVGPGTAPCLDYETQTVYFLSYKASDDEGRGQTSVVSLRIQLTDFNDSPPTCESPLYRSSLDEGATIFDPPLIIKARDPDIVSELNYKLIGNDAIQKLFTIDKKTGQLSVAESALIDVNHLNSEHIYFGVEASDGTYSTFCNVNLTIRDVNNHAPKFSQDTYLASVPENSQMGVAVKQLVATDLDTSINAEVRYRIEQGSFDDFNIDNISGIVIVSRTLDYDRRNTYHIKVLASDLGSPSLTGTSTLIVNIINSNDKAPYFTPSTQRAEVSEGAVVGTTVHTLIALDPDVDNAEALVYAATEPITAVDKNGKEVKNTVDFKDMFAITQNGTVIVNKKLNRDFFAVIRITVLVTDTTAPTIQQGEGLLIITMIDVNESPPVFGPPWTPEDPSYKFMVLEEQPIGTILSSLQVTDADSNIESYEISYNDYFEINNNSGLIKSKSRIDFETVKTLKLKVLVSDSGEPKLTSTADIIVEVININDNDPIFNVTEYNFEVFENSPKGTLVGKVYAKDGDAGIFGEIFYKLVGNQQGIFVIDEQTGEISVFQTSILDREIQSEISLTVVASDRGPVTMRKSSAVPVHIKILDINDNAPIFTQAKYIASIAENAALNPPAAILQITATDADEGASAEVKYYIISGNKNKLFRLDENSGILYPGNSLIGQKGQYTLYAEAIDGFGKGPHSNHTEIVIDVHGINHYRPVFIMPALSNATVELSDTVIRESYLVMTVKASDNDTGDDGKVSYHLQVKNQNVQETDDFVINEITGELRTKRTLNQKERRRYELILVARDQGTPAWFETLRFLTILLVNTKENQPEFPDASNPYKFFITENGPRHARIGKIQAMVPDNSPHISINYYELIGNEDGAFYIDKSSGDIFTNKSLDREETDMYVLYIAASKKSDLHITSEERASLSIPILQRDSTVAKVWIAVLDMNDNAPTFDKDVYYAGVNAKASINEQIVIINATDRDLGLNGTIEMIITKSNLYKFGSLKTVGSIVPSPFAIAKDGRLTTSTYMAEYDQDRFILEIIAKEIEPPYREANAKIYIWVFNSEQLVRVILSKTPSEVHEEREELVSELANVTQKRIIVDEIRYHIDELGRIRMDWCDLYFHAVDAKSHTITPVDDILKVIDSNYDFLKDYYAGYAIENVVPAYSSYVDEEFDIALAALIALIIVLFVGAVSFLVLCCCLKHWVITIPNDVRRKDQLIKKQIIEDLNTTENPLWIEQKLKLYEEQELTMQVFSEPELTNTSGPVINQNLNTIETLGRRDSYGTSQGGDNTYATIQPRSQMGDISDYATLRNDEHAPSMYEFTGSTFQVQQDFVTELI